MLQAQRPLLVSDYLIKRAGLYGSNTQITSVFMTLLSKAQRDDVTRVSVSRCKPTTARVHTPTGQDNFMLHMRHEIVFCFGVALGNVLDER